jgi:hypothetical protein
MKNEELTRPADSIADDDQSCPVRSKIRLGYIPFDLFER